MASNRDEVRVSADQDRSILAMMDGVLAPRRAEPSTGRRIFCGVQLIPDPELTAPAFKNMHDAADWVLERQLASIHAP